MEAIWGILKSDMLNCMTSVETITHSLHKKFHLVFSTGWISLKIFFCFLSVYLTWSCSKAIYGNFYYNHEKTTKIIAITTAILNICFKHPSFLLKKQPHTDTYQNRIKCIRYQCHHSTKECNCKQYKNYNNKQDKT